MSPKYNMLCLVYNYGRLINILGARSVEYKQTKVHRLLNKKRIVHL